MGDPNIDNTVGKFAKVKSEAYKEYGIDNGSLVFIAGSGFAPVDKDDNYKLLFVVSKIEDTKMADQGVIMKRDALELLSDEESEGLLELLDSDYGQEESEGPKTLN